MVDAPSDDDDAAATLAGAPDGEGNTLPGHASGTGAAARGAEDDAELATIDPARYLIGHEIARGGMGRILSARDRRLGRTVAIKELLPGSTALRARFEREARITAKLQHPAIVNLLEAGSWPGGEPFYVMKLVAGESLDRVIAKRTTLEQRLGLLPHIIAAVDALAYAHGQHIIHRDLKPANVLVGEFGETVVIDWGLAKDLTASSLAGDPSVHPTPSPSSGAVDETLAGAVLGTPAYMPAEQALADAVDERADVYALGAMLYHVLSGAAPYVGTSAAEILYLVANDPAPPLAARAPGVPPDLVAIVEKAMARSADDRYPTAKELASDLKSFQTGHLVSAHHYSAWQLLRRALRRHRTAVVVASVAIALLAAMGVVSVRRIVREQARTEQQREVAERSRAAAEDLTGYMLGDLRDKLQPLGKLDLLDDVAQ
ncbi:MAG: serine/threonine-protein kinase, partial [Proteobacteria bacterium]|nr:serine/threonine-protein kinase [Pseudomonadota bacterium]